MPLASFEMQALARFVLSATVTGWDSLFQGDNTNRANLTDLDLEVWDQAYAAKVALAGGATVNVDLSSFTNLANEAVVFTAAHSLYAFLELDDEANTDATAVIAPGASNGLAWFYGAGLTLEAGDTLLKMSSIDNVGVTVDGTHKVVKLNNPGTDDATLTLIILGSTV